MQLPEHVLIAGVGNQLLGDDGVGVVVARELMKTKLPQFIDVRELGTRSLDILSMVEGYSKVVFVDAVRSGKPPGTVTVYRIGDVLDLKAPDLVSLHELDLIATIRIGRLTDRLPKSVVLVGIEPERIGVGISLSETVGKSISEAARLALREATEDEPVSSG